MTKIYYRNGNVDLLVCEVVGHVALIQDALDVCDVNMDEWAEEQGWDDYDPNCLKAEYTND